jgi:resuscitation-promoting factor RpfB
MEHPLRAPRTPKSDQSRDALTASPARRAVGVIAGVAALGLIATSAHGQAVAERERQERQHALEVRAATLQQAVDLDGRLVAAPASRSRSVLSSERIALPFETVTKRTSTLLKGQRKVIEPGAEGVMLRRWQQDYIAGNATTRFVVSETVVRDPQERIVHIGVATPKPKPTAKASTSAPVARESIAAGRTTATKSGTTSSSPTRTTSSSRNSGSWPTVSGAENLNWAALARCESSGNPLAVNKSGPYYGLYQFLPSTWRSVGGSGVPSEASPAEQTYRAKLLYARSGAGQWPTCGKLLFT